jgi:uncharacterized membrane protein YeaQ/YmgE (transglycosylase-associated protein family)
MGFLAYLLVGGTVGWAAGHYFPRFSPSNKGSARAKRPKSAVFLWTIGLGALGALATGYGGQMIGLFTSGQMLEWGSAILGAFSLSKIYLLLRRP